MGSLGTRAGLFIFVLLLVLNAAPLVCAGAAEQRDCGKAASHSSEILQSLKTSVHLAATSIAFGERLSEGKPVHVSRPRVMALIGFGLLAIGALLRRREGNRI